MFSSWLKLVVLTVQVFQTAKALSEHLGKTVCLSLDRPGFIVNRILMPMVNEAFYTLMEVCRAIFLTAMDSSCMLECVKCSVRSAQ